MTHPSTFTSLALIAAMSLSGCSWLADVSSTMRVDTGLAPENIDRNVRFRTTYYFRVLTGCRMTEPDKKEHVDAKDSAFAKRISGTFIPLHDSLYRFRMTGQAAALFNKVHFESGVLHKEQIDQFGSSVKYNDQTNSFIPLSAEEVRADAKTQAAHQDIETFRKIYKDISSDSSLKDRPTDQQALLLKLIAMIEDRLDQVKGSRPSNDNNTAPPPGSTTNLAPSSTKLQNFKDELSKTETALQKAKGDLASATNDLTNAKTQVGQIGTELTAAKTALTDQTPPSDAIKDNINRLTKELSEAQTAMGKAETNRQQAEAQTTALKEKIGTIKSEMTQAHNTLVEAQGKAVRSLQDLSTKIEALLTELGATKSTAQPHSAEACSGKPSENKYYLLGPEGAKELNPNDRLLLALSVESKPLISALQQLSERKMQAAGTNIKTVETLLEERGRILDTKTLLHKATTDAGKATGPTDQSDLKTLLNALRKPYVTETTSTPAK